MEWSAAKLEKSTLLTYWHELKSQDLLVKMLLAHFRGALAIWKSPQF